MSLEDILKRGFGLYIINGLLSLKYYNNQLTLVIGPLPGYNPDPVYIEISSRRVPEIYEECFDFVTQYLALYTEWMQGDLRGI